MRRPWVLKVMEVKKFLVQCMASSIHDKESADIWSKGCILQKYNAVGSPAGACWAAHWMVPEQEESSAVEWGAQPHLPMHLTMEHESHV